MAFITVEEVIRARARRDVVQAMLDQGIMFLDDYFHNIELAVTELIKHRDYDTEAQLYVKCWNAIEMKEQHSC